MTGHTTNLRREYHRAELGEATAEDDPIAQFRTWFDEAVASSVPEPNAMVVATVDASGQPSTRTVLLKGFDDAGFVFYTNYAGRKGVDLAGNPAISLLFYWAELERQVRIDGRAERTSPEEADAYWAARPRGSQIGSLASPQSQVIPDRAWLATRYDEIAASVPEDAPIPRPSHWGGIRVVPAAIEFWQGRPNRLHDRLRYRRVDGDWLVERLAP